MKPAAALLRLALALALPLLSGCPKKGEPTPAPVASGGATSTSAGPQTDASQSVSRDLVAEFDDCSLGHLGPLVDLGDKTARAGFDPKLRAAPPEMVEREGGTWMRVNQRVVSISFVLDTPPSSFVDPVVMARVRGGSARSVSVFLNDHVLGTFGLTRGEAKVEIARGAESALLEGRNQLALHFGGASRGSTDELAEIDWIHVGPVPSDGAYAAPTRQASLTSSTLGGVPKRAVSLRAPGYMRCSGMFPSGGAVDVSVGLAGATEGEVEVRWLRDRLPPQVLTTVRIGAAEASQWKNVRVPLGEKGESGSLGAVVLVAKSASKGGRILFGEPKIIGPSAASTPKRSLPPSRGVVLVVMGSLSPRGLSIYGGPRVLPELSTLAANGIVFEAQRATTTVPPGTVASMLTGLEPLAHGVTDYDRKLPANVTTVADAARQGGVTAAMFTANPLTGAAFGFDRAWTTYEAVPPGTDAPAVSVFDKAAEWIGAHAEERFLVVVHARGGHPPWDTTVDELKGLAPEGYTGGIDPKHAAELLAKARRVPPVLRYAEQDRVRTWALYDVAVAAHDAALGRLMAAIRAAGRDSDTTVIVTGDASVDEAAHVPFGDGETLDEAVLRVPLVVRPAAPAEAARMSGRVPFATSAADVARTMLDALGLEPPAAFKGIDLASASSPSSETRPLLATLGDRFSLRWGSFVLTGARGREPRLCNLALEPVCVTDVRATHPIATEAILREAWDALTALPAAPPHESPSLDAQAAAALRAWGR